MWQHLLKLKNIQQEKLNQDESALLLLKTEITHQYGIKMTEQQLYDYIFCRKIDV